MNTPSVALDESGSLSDPNDIVVAVAWISGQDDRGHLGERTAKVIISRAWRKFTTRRGKRSALGEFKFHHVEERDRRRVLDALAQSDVRLGILVVEKGKQKVPDTPEDYGALVAEAIASAQAHFGTANLRIVLDRHFSSHKDRETLATLLMDALDLSEPPTFADSQTAPLVQLADFVAGAAHAKFGERADSQYADLIAQKIVVETRTTWKELKAKWVERFPTKKR